MICPYCGSEAVIHDASFIYGYRYKGSELWVCSKYPECDSYCSASMLATLANKELREIRVKCHKQFDKLWQSREMSRTEAYAWLQDRLFLPKEDAHIGLLDINQCHDLLGLLQERVI